MLQDEEGVSTLELGGYIRNLCGTVIDSSHIEGVHAETACLDDIIMDSKKAITVDLLFFSNLAMQVDAELEYNFRRSKKFRIPFRAAGA